MGAQSVQFLQWVVMKFEFLDDSLHEQPRAVPVQLSYGVMNLQGQKWYYGYARFVTATGEERSNKGQWNKTDEEKFKLTINRGRHINVREKE